MFSPLRKALKMLQFMGNRAVFWLLLVALSGFVLSVSELATAGLLQMLLQKFGIVSERAYLPFGIVLPELSDGWFALCFALLAISRAATTVMTTYGSIVAQEIMGLRLRFLLYYECLDRPKGYVSYSTFHYRMAQWIPNAVAFCSSLSLLLPNLIYTAVLVLALTQTSLRLSSVCIIGIVLIGVPTKILFRRVRHASLENSRAQGRLQQFLYEGIRNFFFLKAMALTSHALHTIVARSLHLSARNLRMLFVTYVTGALPTMLAGCLISCLIALQLHFRWIEPMPFIAFLYLFLRFGQALSSTGSLAASMNSTYPLFRETASYFFSFDEASRMKPIEQAHHINARGNVSIQEANLRYAITPDSSPPPSITLEDVSFRYPNSSKDVISHFHLSVPSGGIVGIKGESGAGKSTLLALIMGIIEPSEGKISVNGEKPEKYYASPLPRVGYVGAEPYMIEGSIRENLLFGVRGIYTDEDMIERLKQAHLWNDFVREGKTLDYTISELGEGLSAGQKQRLSLARALFTNPKIIILDEATANLDLDSEAKIMETVATLKGKSTILIVSHKPKPLEYVDQIVHLRFGGNPS